MPQAVRSGGGFVHLITATATTSAISTATALAAITTRATALALRLALASRSGLNKMICFVSKQQENKIGYIDK